MNSVGDASATWLLYIRSVFSLKDENVFGGEFIALGKEAGALGLFDELGTSTGGA